MEVVLGVVSLALLLVEVVLVARAVLDWSTVLAGPSATGSVRGRLLWGVQRVTDPILVPVRRVLPPIRVGTMSIDIAFIVVFVGIVLIREFIS